MAQNRLLKTILILIVTVAVFHVVAFKFYLYDEIWWVDVVIHFLGGLWIGLFLLWLLFFSGFFNLKPKKILLAFIQTAFVIGIGIGVLWEIFEFKTGITFFSPQYWPDTILDLIMDTSGAMVGAFYCFKLRREDLKNNLVSN